MKITTKALVVAIIALLSPISSFAASPVSVTTPGQLVRATTGTVATGDKLSVTISNNSSIAKKFSINELQPYTTNLVSTLTNGVNGMSVADARAVATQNIANIIKNPVRHTNSIKLANTFYQDPAAMEKFATYGDISLHSIQCGNASELGAAMAVRTGLWNWSDTRTLSWNGQHTLLETRQGQSGNFAVTDFDSGMPSLTTRKSATPLEFASVTDFQTGTATPIAWTSPQGYSVGFGTPMSNYNNIVSQTPNQIGNVTPAPLSTQLSTVNKFVLCPGCSMKWKYTHPRNVVDASNPTNYSRLAYIGTLFAQYSTSGSQTIANQITTELATLGVTAPDMMSAVQSLVWYFGSPVEVYSNAVPTVEITIPQNHANTIVIGPSNDLHIPLFVLGGTITGGTATIGTSTQSGTFSFPLYNPTPIGAPGYGEPTPTPSQIQVLTSGSFPPGVGGTIRLSYNPGAFSFVRGFTINGNSPLTVTTSHLKPDVVTTANPVSTTVQRGKLPVSSVGGPLQP